VRSTPPTRNAAEPDPYPNPTQTRPNCASCQTFQYYLNDMAPVSGTGSEQRRTIEDRFINEWGLLANAWGVSPLLGRIHGLLLLVGRPMTAEEVCERLDISRASASVQTARTSCQRSVAAQRVFPFAPSTRVARPVERTSSKSSRQLSASSAGRAPRERKTACR